MSVRCRCKALRGRGVALLTAMLVVALATVAAVAITSRQQLDVRRAGNVFAQDQAYLYALAVEAYALGLLDTFETIDELPWNGCRSPEIPMAIDDARMKVWIEDLQCRFNLNRLQPGDDAALADFVALLNAIRNRDGGVQADPETLGRAIRDWLDPQSDDPVYRNRRPSYVSANQPMLDPSELRLVGDMDAATWRVLSPYVTALPVTDAGVRLLGAPQAIRDVFGEPQSGKQAASRFYRIALQVELGRHRLLQCSVLDAETHGVLLRELAACGP